MRDAPKEIPERYFRLIQGPGSNRSPQKYLANWLRGDFSAVEPEKKQATESHLSSSRVKTAAVLCVCERGGRVEVGTVQDAFEPPLNYDDLFARQDWQRFKTCKASNLAAACRPL
ncbi:predicted protein [Plenodomus lingam JN3]|uniref:Predicted protein n=1 Tax=Leptosphaeria maculans (strain JN3 / isolate v23.1.3 / race Av1-4-5-6-7-8) TaxID=985895 RepID=E5A4U2_LEPMJ|nr:predicted protein [Plenodomus lingam JN3]CBX98640.1 predicted protein [Plenodomus lingam JN3]